MAETQEGLVQRRKFPRRPFNRPVGCLYKGVYQVLQPEMIGEGGMSLYFSEKVEEGDRVVVNFALPGTEFCCLTAEVRYCYEREGQYVFGLQFSNPEFYYKKSIRRFVSSTEE